MCQIAGTAGIRQLAAPDFEAEAADLIGFVDHVVAQTYMAASTKSTGQDSRATRFFEQC